MSLEYFYEIAVIAPIPATLFIIADHAHENIAAIDTKRMLILSNKEVSPKYYVERYHFEIFQLYPGVFLRDSPDWTYSSNII